MRIYQASIVICFSILLGGCSGETVSQGLDVVDDVKDWFEGSDTDTSSPNDSTIPDLGEATGSDTQITNPFVESVLTNSEELVPIQDSETSQLTTGTDFLFKTARSIRLKVDLPSAAGTQASLSLCTEFEESDAGYTINYESCPIRGAVIDGQFQSDIAFPNQFESAIAVIWFPYQESEPIYRKFQLADIPEGTAVREWLWN